MSEGRKLELVALKLAAKAAGIVRGKHKFLDNSDEEWDAWIFPNGSAATNWNSFTNDGDCAYLESILLLNVKWGDESVSVGRSTDSWVIEMPYLEYGGDKQKARRYASTLAAAEIGRAIG